MTITYPVNRGLYINMTNRCPCACTFCLRKNGDSVYGSEPLWLEREPTVKEICDSIDSRNLDDFDELVFCGYGEPTERLEDLLAVAAYVKKKSAIRIRINTNGLSDLINGGPTAWRLEGLIDAVSVSLNATNSADYLRVVRPRFGEGSYEAMLNFTADAAKFVPDVMMTVVDEVTSGEEQEKSREICQRLGARLRVRPLET